MEVDKSVVPWFRAAAAQLLEQVGDPEEALAMALAKVTGFSTIKVRNIGTFWCYMQIMLMFHLRIAVCRHSGCGTNLCRLRWLLASLWTKEFVC